MPKNCRVYTNPDGTLGIRHPNWTRFDPDQESEEEYTDRLCGARHETKSDTSTPALPFVDVDTAVDIPDTRVEFCDRCQAGHPSRSKWRMIGGKVRIDPSLESKHEVMAHIHADIDDELDLPTPDIVKIKRKERDLRRLKKETWTSRQKSGP